MDRKSALSLAGNGFDILLLSLSFSIQKRVVVSARFLHPLPISQNSTPHTLPYLKAHTQNTKHKKLVIVITRSIS